MELSALLVCLLDAITLFSFNKKVILRYAASAPFSARAEAFSLRPCSYIIFTAPLFIKGNCFTNQMKLLQTVEKSPLGLFRRTSAPRALIVGYADNSHTCADRSVFSTGNPWKK